MRDIICNDKESEDYNDMENVVLSQYIRYSIWELNYIWGLKDHPWIEWITYNFHNSKQKKTEV